jgi:hypothetical protein
MGQIPSNFAEYATQQSTTIYEYSSLVNTEAAISFRGLTIGFRNVDVDLKPCCVFPRQRKVEVAGFCAVPMPIKRMEVVMDADTLNGLNLNI